MSTRQYQATQHRMHDPFTVQNSMQHTLQRKTRFHKEIASKVLQCWYNKTEVVAAFAWEEITSRHGKHAVDGR